MDGWEQNHDYSDADCRMTAFLLLDGILRAESTEENYEGTYLMFDTEAIDNVDRYSILKEKRDMFTTLYGEKSVTDDKHPEAAFSDSWKQYGFTVDSDRISLLSIVIHDPYSLNDAPFLVGHSGKGINKSYGMEKYLEYVGLTRKDAIAFGDGPNDLDMLSFAETGVAMGNGLEEVKKLADFVTKDINENGIAYALKELGLIK